MGDKNQTTGDEAGERAERLAKVRENHQGHLTEHPLNECWEYQDTAFLLAELDRKHDKQLAVERELREGLDAARAMRKTEREALEAERDAAIASRNAWAEKASELREALVGQVRRLYTDYGSCFCAEPRNGRGHDSACAVGKAALAATEEKP